MDYILLSQLEDQIKPEVSFNPDEISEVKWIPSLEIIDYFEDFKSRKEIIAPWFEKIIAETKILDAIKNV